jgi:hypothetical protein
LYELIRHVWPSTSGNKHFFSTKLEEIQINVKIIISYQKKAQRISLDGLFKRDMSKPAECVLEDSSLLSIPMPDIAFINSIGEWKLSHFITKKVNLSTQISISKKRAKYIGK